MYENYAILQRNGGTVAHPDSHWSANFVLFKVFLTVKISWYTFNISTGN